MPPSQLWHELKELSRGLIGVILLAAVPIYVCAAMLVWWLAAMLFATIGLGAIGMLIAPLCGVAGIVLYVRHMAWLIGRLSTPRFEVERSADGSTTRQPSYRD